MQLVDNDTFLKQLAALFEEHGTIWLTHKRLTFDAGDSAMKTAEGEVDTRGYPCLLRAIDGKDTKFSTKIEIGQLEKFHAAYGALLKSSMVTLRKRDKKREKLRTEQSAKRKHRMTELIVIDGPKRGNGRRKRQRKIKAALKQQQSQQKFKEREESKVKGRST